MRRYTKIQGASTESGAGLEGDGGGTRSQAMVTHSVRFLLRMGDLLGCGLSLDDDELEECVPELLRGKAEDKEEEVRRRRGGVGGGWVGGWRAWRARGMT